MPNIPRPSRHVLHEETEDTETKRFDLGIHLRRYKPARSVTWLLIMLAVLLYLMYFLINMPVK